jgi:hypothetical protein
MIIGEYSGIQTSSPLDTYTQAFSTTGSTATDGVTSGTATTTANSDMIIGHILEKGTVGTDAPGTGFTQRLYTGLSQAYMEDKVQPTAGSVAATMTFGTANHYSVNMMAFKAATVAPSTLASYTYQAPALNSATQYWWRAYAIDPGDSNSFSPASAIETFTTEGPPNAPTLISPAAGETNVAQSPLFRLNTIDVNGENVKYKIQVCSNSSCSSVLRTIDQTASQSGWQSQNTDAVTTYSVDMSVLANSQIALHQYQSPILSLNTQYWWRAYAIDPGGSNMFSPASAIHAFTTTNDTAGERVLGGTKITGGTKIGQ